MIFAIACPELYGLFMGETTFLTEEDIYTALVILAQHHPDEEGVLDQLLKGIEPQAYEGLTLGPEALRSYLLQGSLMLYELLQRQQICPPFVNDLEFVSVRSPGQLLLRKLG